MINSLHNPRWLVLSNTEFIKEEFARINVHPAGVKMMSPRADFIPIRLDNLTPPQAIIIKQELLSRGGEAAVSQGTVDNKVDKTKTLLLGTPDMYKGLIENLRIQPFRLKKIAAELETILEYWINPLKFSLKLRDRSLRLFPEPAIMGIVNVTPDSFSDGGEFLSTDEAIKHALELAKEGADIIDIGGESSRPGSDPVSEKDEIERVIPVIKGIRKKSKIPISIDTTKPEVAKAAVKAGADIINDISALSNGTELAEIAAKAKIPIILMHMKGTPKTMQKDTGYEDLMGEIIDYLRKASLKAIECGVKDTIVDPGIGFGKSLEGNCEILRRLYELRSLGLPVLVGPSRKSTIGKLLGDAPVDKREFGTAAAVALSVAGGANIIRVHNVKDMKDVVKVSSGILNL